MSSSNYYVTIMDYKSGINLKRSIEVLQDIHINKERPGPRLGLGTT